MPLQNIAYFKVKSKDILCYTTLMNLIKKRCAWAETNDLFIPYHDEEWGVVVHDDRLLFEMLNLEGAQAGLS